MEIVTTSGPDSVGFSESCASIHEAAFAPSGARGWSTREFADLLQRDTVFLLTTSDAFLLGETVLGEAEVLTLAVRPEKQRCGCGAMLLLNFIDQCTYRKVSRIFLEVALDNHAAIALYKAVGFLKSGIRPNYFRRKDGLISAILMQRVITDL